jgi:hypothetical protein
MQSDRNQLAVHQKFSALRVSNSPHRECYFSEEKVRSNLASLC